MQALEIFAIGVLVGLAGGMLGIGGSIVLIPALTEVMGPNQHLYQAAAMIVNFFVAVPAVYQHRRAKAIDRGTVLRLMPLTIVSVILGVACSESSFFTGQREPYLRGLFGLFLVSCGLAEMYRMYRPAPHEAGAAPQARAGGDKSPHFSWGLAAVVAIPTGLTAGLLGVGGGIVAVPLQRRFLGIPIRNAIANSAAVIIATSLVGATVKNYAYLADRGWTWEPFVLAGIVIPTAIVGSLLGSRLVHRMPVRAVKTVFVIVLLIAAVRLVLGAYRSLPVS